jgi:hypothetical protein
MAIAATCARSVEITESLVMENVAGTIEKIKALRDLGMSVAIDDFGTGIPRSVIRPSYPRIHSRATARSSLAWRTIATP